MTSIQANVKNPFPINNIVNLGRVLFYDKNLSVNGQVSCGSCHMQKFAFTDGLAFSNGFNGQKTTRSAMSIQNMAFINNYQWESATDNLEELVSKPLLHAVEMGNQDINDVILRIKSVGYYDEVYQKAYGNTQIDSKSTLWALAQFVGSIYSSSTKFDKGLSNQFSDFTREEKHGKELFEGEAQCNHCHAAPLFAAPDFTGGAYGKSTATINTDLKNAMEIDKKGLANNGLKDNTGAFKKIKIPTLRNIEYTAPYMHDGRFNTLDEVLDHYDHGMVANENLDEILIDKKGFPKKLNLSTSDKQALKVFLLTLSDEELVSAKRYSDPFK